MPQCLYCGKDIAGDFWIVKRNGNEDVFCSERCADLAIETKYRFCFSCGEIIDGQSWFYSDGRVFCDNCYRTAVTDHEQLEKNWETVLDIFREKFHYEPPCCLTTRFMDDDPDQEKDIRYVDILGYHCFLKLDERHSVCRIYIHRGLPAEICQSTMAHELAHDLMYHIWGDPDDKAITEGFAVYMQSLYNIEAGHLRQNRNIDATRKTHDSAPDPYSTGYKLISDIASDKGYAAVMSFMREAAAKANLNPRRK